MRNYFLVLLIISGIFLAGCGQTCPKVYDPVCGADGKTYNNSCLADNAGVLIEKNGSCEAAAAICTDSDGGNDIFEKGSTVAAGQVYDDACDGLSKVKEYFCDGNALSVHTYPCPSGFACKLGKCEQTPCIDSDGGITADVRGTATADQDSGTDECSSGKELKEYYCEGGVVASKSIDCLAGEVCADGACVEATCSDSDGGKDKMEKGTASDGADEYQDTCKDAATVKEYYCESNEIKSEDIACGTGYICEEGKCIVETCVDTDGGKDKLVKGTTSFSGVSQTDNCYSSSELLEYYCGPGNSIKMEKIACGSLYECYNGICREIECQKDQQDIDIQDENYEIVRFGNSQELILFEDMAIELSGGLILELTNVGANDTTFRLYDSYADYQDDDEICTHSIDEGDTENDICSESTGEIEVTNVDSGDNYAELKLERFYVMQYYSEEGIDVDWWGSSNCPDDVKEFDKHTSYFYPYLDTDSTGLDLEDKKFKLFGMDAVINDIDNGQLNFEFDGKTLDLEDGDTFTFDDVKYQIDIHTNDGGIDRIIVEQD